MISRPKQILNEVTQLKMLDTTTKIVNFLKDEYGLTSSVEAVRPDEFLDVYLTDYRHAEDIELTLPEDKIAKALLKLFNEIHKDEDLKAINVWPTEFGYTIIMDRDESKELTENVLYYYYYNTMTRDRLEEEESNGEDSINLNENHSMRHNLREARDEEEAALQRVLGTRGSKKEAPKAEVRRETDEIEQDIEEINKADDIIDDLEIEDTKLNKDEIEQDASNILLDNRFIWFFTVLDADANELSDEIDSLDEAINFLVEADASMLVAYPYIDPNPEDEDVELVFADNPGPVIVYDGEVA